MESIYRLIELPPKESLSVYVNNENSVSNNKIFVPYRILNIGNGNPVPLEEFINYIEIFSGKKAKKNYLEMQRGDVKDTHSDCSLIENLIRFKPNTPIEVGVEKYVNWFKEYYSK